MDKESRRSVSCHCQYRAGGTPHPKWTGPTPGVVGLREQACPLMEQPKPVCAQAGKDCPVPPCNEGVRTAMSKRLDVR